MKLSHRQNKKPLLLMTVCSFMGMTFESHLTSSGSGTDIVDNKNTILSPRSSTIIELKIKTKNHKFIKKNRKESILLIPFYSWLKASWTKAICLSQRFILFFSPSISPIHISPFLMIAMSCSFWLSPSFSTSSSFCFNFSNTTSFLVGIFTLCVLFAPGSIPCFAFLFLIGALCTTGLSGGEAGGEKDAD